MKIPGLSHVSTFWSLIREVRTDQIIVERNLPVDLVVVGPDAALREAVREALLGPGAAPALPLLALRSEERLDLVPAGTPNDRLVLHVVPVSAGPDVLRQLRESVPPDYRRRYVYLLDQPSDPTLPTLVNKSGWQNGYSDGAATWIATDVRDPQRLIRDVSATVLAAFADRPIAVGFRHPGLRQAAATTLILQASRVNAEFALVSSLPATIPVVGGLASAGADMIVLTKNQLLLALKIAALAGRPLEPVYDVVVELLPVVGSAFLWRTIARTLAAFVPAPAGALPKTAIAYVGTYVIGRIASTYYLSGVRPPREAIAQYTREAWEHLRAWRKRT